MKKQRFFGHPESPLFGVYHKPRGIRSGSPKAVVICPPVGQEYNRTHWALRLMANQIARRGVHVLRMDYHGIGDSAQRSDEIDSLAVWRNDISTAIDHLRIETGAETVMLIGQRFGGTLAAQVARVRADVNSVVLWEPVIDGEVYLSRLRKMHARMLDLWVCKMATPNNDSEEEILGSRYRRSLLNEMEQVKLEFDSIVQPQLIVDADGTGDEISISDPGVQKIIRDQRPTTWNDFAELESAFLRPEIMREIVNLVDDMFKRLSRFGVLESTTGAMQ